MPLRGWIPIGCQSCPVSVTARPSAPAGQAPSTPLPLVVAGAGAGVAGAVLSYLVFGVVALGAWMLDPSGSQEWTQMLEVASGAWLSGLHLAPTVDGITLTLLPWGFGIVALVAVMTAARWAADASAVAKRGEALAAAGAVALGFATVSAIIAALGGSLGIPATRAAVTGGIAAFVVALPVIARRAGLLSWDRIPAAVRDVVAATSVALLSLVAAAGVLLAVAVILSFDEITVLLVQLDAGLSGLLMLAVLSLGYLPVAITWALAYLLGPGVTVSVGASVSPYAETSTTALPGLPLLAALPGQAPAGAVLLPLVGVLAGALAGALLRRRGRTGGPGVLLAAAVAVASAAGVALASWLASGSLGDTSLQGLGPAPLLVGLIGGLVVAVGALAVTAWPSRGAHG